MPRRAGRYGWPRVWRQLKARGIRVGKRRVELAMRRNGLRARGKRRFRVSTTDSNHALPIAPNLLARNFTVAAANTVWAGDMTYIPTREGWLYLAVVLDLFSRRIVGWAMGADDRQRSWPAARSTWPGYSRSPGQWPDLPQRSRQSVCQPFYTDLLAGHGIKASMSRKGNCWDNACSETLFGSLKVERLHGMDLKNHREAKDATLDWLLWYNRIKDPLDTELRQSDAVRTRMARQNWPPAASQNRPWKSRKAKNASQLSHSLDCYEFLTGYGIRILRARSLRSKTQDPTRPHSLRTPLQTLDSNTRQIYPQPNPLNAGTEHLGTC